MDVLDRLRAETRWLYEAYQDDYDNTIYRIYGEDDDSVEATLCEVWGDEDICKEICDAHNRIAETMEGNEILILEPSGVELVIERRSDGKWRFVHAVHHGEANGS